jgi:hypothetical protein
MGPLGGRAPMISTALLNLASDMAILVEMVMGDERQCFKFKLGSIN